MVANTNIKLQVLGSDGPLPFANVARVNAQGIPVGGSATGIDGTTWVQADSCYLVKYVGYHDLEFCIGLQDEVVQMQPKVFELAGVTIYPAKTMKWGLIAAIAVAALAIIYFATKK
jgi:hypothetical protein